MKTINLTLIIIFLLLTNLSFIAAEIPDVDVTLLNQDPDPAQQGEIVEVRFKIANIGTSTTEDVEVEILPSYPFTLYSGEKIRKLGKLPASQTGADTVVVDYKLRVDPKAIEGENELELDVRIGDQIFHYNNKEFEIDIQEYTSPDLKVYIRENTILQPLSKGVITVEVANVDITSVKFLQFTLLPSEDYQLISSSEYVYMGDIDSDDTESEDFEIFVKEVTDGVVNLKAKIIYQDSKENKFETEADLSFKVYSPNELAKYGIIQESYTKYIIILLVIAGIIWYFRRKKKNR